MHNTLKLLVDPIERADGTQGGQNEEEATIGRFVISINDHPITEGIDLHEGTHKDGPLVAGYPVAEWLVWNWWRLLWEAPKVKDTHWHRKWDETAPDWGFAHSMATIGDGFCWPDIFITSDGFMTEFVCQPSHSPDSGSFQFITAHQAETIPAKAFVQAVERFVKSTLDRLADAGVKHTNLQTLWSDLTSERADPELTRFRRMEARLGLDPDEDTEEDIETLLCEAQAIGENAFEELVSHCTRATAPSVIRHESDLREWATCLGFAMKADDAVCLENGNMLAQWGTARAWKVGVAAARQVRAQEKLSLDRITNPRLADLAGVPRNSIKSQDKCTSNLSFMYDEQAGRSHVAFRSKWATSRRFDLARLIGDRLFATEGRLFPATATYSYRQKAQRAFAAELLSPWEAVREMTHGDESEETKNETAEHFAVSPLVIQNMMEDNA